MTRTRFASLAGRRRAVVVACCVALVGLVGVASASWLTSKGATGSAGATSVQAVANASVSLTVVSSTEIDVKVTNVPAGGPTPSSYLIKNGTTTVCATAALNANCQNTGLTANTSYTYNVFSNLNNWVSSGNATASTTTQAGVVTHAFTVTPASTTQTAGTAFNVTLVAKANGATDTAYSGNKTLDWAGGLTSPGGTAPAYPTNPVNFVSGTATVSVTLFKASSTAQTLSVADHNDNTYNGTTTTGITVDSAGVQLGFSGGSPAANKVPKNGNTTFTLTVPNDAYGNVFTHAAAISVTLTLTPVNGSWGFSSAGLSTSATTTTLTITSGPAGNTFSVFENNSTNARTASLSATTSASGFTAPSAVTLTSSP